MVDLFVIGRNVCIRSALGGMGQMRPCVNTNDRRHIHIAAMGSRGCRSATRGSLGTAGAWGIQLSQNLPQIIQVLGDRFRPSVTIQAGLLL